MNRVVVVGCFGQLGTDLVGVLREQADNEVIGLGHRDIDVTDEEAVRVALHKARPDVVINCAAFVRVDDCETQPKEAFSVNAIGAMCVARICAELNATCLHVSTDYVFSGEKKYPYHEEDPPDPINVYGASKLAGEYLVRAYCPKHLIVRTSGLYGIAGAGGKDGNFVETMIRMAREGSVIRVVDDEVVSPTYSKDLAGRIKELIKAEVYGTYHITNSGFCSWYQFAQEIIKLSSLRADLRPVTASAYGAKARRPSNSVLTSEYIHNGGMKSLRTWPSALEAYLTERSHQLG